MGAPVVHFEIGCRNSQKATKFYSDLFGWKIEQQGPAAMIDTQGAGVGIGGHITALGHEPNNYITFYAQVNDLQAYLKKAESQGGKTIIPPQEVPGMGQFAWFADPDGNVIGLWKPL